MIISIDGEQKIIKVTDFQNKILDSLMCMICKMRKEEDRYTFQHARKQILCSKPCVDVILNILSEYFKVYDATNNDDYMEFDKDGNKIYFDKIVILEPHDKNIPDSLIIKIRL